MANEAKRRPSRLGKGLSSLMQSPVSVSEPPPAAEPAVRAVLEAAASDGGGDSSGFAGPPSQQREQPGASEAETTGEHHRLERVAVADIQPNPNQPRQHFDDAALDTLADSIRRDGLMQPIILRATPGSGEGYQIVAGERRWRAAQRAGLSRVPAIVRDLDDAESAQWALIENLQREDLNPMERAEAFRRLGELFDLSHDEIAERVGLDRSTITNLLRLLRLEPNVQSLVRDGLLSMGQSRALAGLTDSQAQRALADRAVREGMSVRQVEAAARAVNDTQAASTAGANTGGSRRQISAQPAHLADLERSLAAQLGTKVLLRTARKKGAGTLCIEFYSLEQFDDLLERLGVSTEV